MKVAPESISQPQLEKSEKAAKKISLPGWGLDALALLFFGAFSIYMTWPLTPNLGRTLEQWGDALLQTWTLDWGAYILRTNPLHWTDANSFYPYNNSLAFTETLIGQTFLVAPVIWLTDNPVLAYNLLALGSFIFCGWGTYLLAKDLTSSRLTGLVAGTIFAFFPHRYGQLSHLHLLAAQWMPFCLLYLRKFLQGSPPKLRHGLLFGFFFALQLLSSTYLGLFLVVAVGLYLAYRAAIWLWQNRRVFDGKEARYLSPWRSWLRRFRFNKIVRLGLIFLAVGLVVLPFYWPFLQVQQDLGFERSANEVQSFSALPYYYLDVPKENKLNQDFYRKVFTQGWWESSSGGERGLFLGVLASLLGIFGSWVAWRNRRKLGDGLFYFILTVLAISFTFGPYWQAGRFGSIPLPYYALYNFVPGFAAIRVPVRFIYVVALGVAILAAFGVGWLQNRWAKKSWQTVLLGVGLLGLLTFEYRSDVNLQQSDILRREPPAVMKWLNEKNAPALHVTLSGSDNSNLFLQYWTRGSWRPVMNGFSGFMPPAYDNLKLAVAREGFSPRVIQLLQGLELRYIVVETEDPLVIPQWPKLKAGLEKYATLAVTFDSTYVYELKPDNWLTGLKSVGLTPDSAVYFVEYRRNDPLLLELTASFLQSEGLIKRENLYGSLSLGYRQLPPLPSGKPADFLFLQSGEDPTLYGFEPAGKVFENTLLTVYKKSYNLVARYDFSRQSNSPALNRTKSLAFSPEQATWKLSDNLPASSSAQPSLYANLAVAVNARQKLTVATGFGKNYELELQPGLSVFALPEAQAGFTITGNGRDAFSLVSVEIYNGSLNLAALKPTLRQDVVLLSATSTYDDKAKKSQAEITIVPPGTGNREGFTATLDVYNRPWGSHPSGHYGYWSLPVPSQGVSRAGWQLDLTRKQVETTLNGNSTPNYPPDPKDLDIRSYGNLGDFRASLNLYAGDKLVSNVRLFDFTVWTQGDKNKIENRRAGAFTGYDTAFALLVLPKGA